MAKSGLSKGIRRHIRQKKAEIRNLFGFAPEGEAKIRELYEKFSKKKTEEKAN